MFNMVLEEPGRYVFVIGYTSPMNRRQMVSVSMKPEGLNETVGKATLYECQYR